MPKNGHGHGEEEKEGAGDNLRQPTGEQTPEDGFTVTGPAEREYGGVEDATSAIHPHSSRIAITRRKPAVSRRVGLP